MVHAAEMMQPAGPRGASAGWLDGSAKARSQFDQGWWVNRVKSLFGKGYPEQMTEIRRLGDMVPRIQPEEYYELGLYDPSRLGDALDGKYVGRASWAAVIRRFNDPHAVASLPDRLSLLGTLAHRKVPVPRPLGIFSRTGDTRLKKTFDDGPSLATFLRYGDVLPSVGKPLAHGVGAIAVLGYEEAEDCLLLEDGKRVSVTAFVNAVQRFGYNGYLFEEYLNADAEFAASMGPRVPILRMTVWLGGEDAKIFRPVLKLSDEKTQNSVVGQTGDMIASVNTKTGRLLNTIWRRGPVEDQVVRHPHTRTALDGFAVPDWKEIVLLVKRAAHLFPKLHLQRWDIALSDRGPVVMDVGANIDIQLAQKAWGRGLLDSPLGKLVKNS